LRADDAFSPRVLRLHMRRRGLSPKDLARGIGTTRVAVTIWLSGKGLPMPENLKKISEFLAGTPELEIDLGRMPPRNGHKNGVAANVGLTPVAAREDAHDLALAK
jgi:transcriptional regulator with XRE-family HTH domain